MSIHLAEAQLVVSEGVRAAPPPPPPLFEAIEAEDDDRLAVARGVLGAVIISMPFWILIGFTIYMLL
jgi:hypothetical protein